MPHHFMGEVSGNEIKGFGDVILWIVGLTLAVAAFVRLFRAREATRLEQPLEVRAHKEFATLEQQHQLEKEMHALREQRRADIASLHRKIDDGLLAVRADIASEFKEVRADGVRRGEDIAALKAEGNHHTRQMQVIEAKVDHLPERIQKLLGIRA